MVTKISAVTDLKRELSGLFQTRCTFFARKGLMYESLKDNSIRRE
jgi:hypothetical protein